MSIFCSIVLAGTFLSNAYAQTSTYVSPGVPTDEPVSGDYTGAYRPRVHFSPPKNFMNDPNGLHVDANGTWHLYYQYNPVEPVAGEQHWGHATSTNLYHWENQKIAIWPTNSTNYIYSGSAVVDANNTSGFFPNQDNGVVAMYTLAVEDGYQVQNIAYSFDDGYTFQQYENNPVINIQSPQFRDPQVTWHNDTQRWVVAIAHATEFKIEFYSSENLLDWTPHSNFSHAGLLGLQYECPNLVEIPVEGSSETMHLLYISINPGAPLGGSVGQYFIGSFNGTHFEAIDAAAHIADFGKDNYASQFFWGIPGSEDQVSIAWASNWQYTSVVPTGTDEGWRSQMSLPRRNYLKSLPEIGYVMVSEPYNIQSVFSSELGYRNDIANNSLNMDFSTVESLALYFEANVTGLSEDNLAGTVNFTFTSSISGEFVTGGTIVGGDTWMDRGHTYAFDNAFFTDKFSATGVYGGQGEWRISGVIDRSIIEIFVNGGEQSATNTFYSTYPLDTLRFGAAGIANGAQVSVGVWGLEDTWASLANSNGTVVGNVTRS